MGRLIDERVLPPMLTCRIPLSTYHFPPFARRFCVQPTTGGHGRKGVGMNLEDLSPEMQETVRACESPEEILVLARKVGHTLSDVELEVIDGGEEKWHRMQCPRCGSWDVEERTSITGTPLDECLSCNHRWTFD